MNALPSEQAAIVGVINPESTAATKTTAWVEASKFHRFMAIVQAGALGSVGILTAKLEQGTLDSPPTAKDITGKAIANLTKASPDQSNKQAIINLRSDELDVNGGYHQVRLSITGSANSPANAAVLAGLLLGFMPRYAPASDHDADSVAEIVT